MKVRVLLATLFWCFLTISPAFAVCPTRFLNPITDVCWDCIFPIKIGSGVPLGFGASPTCDLPVPGNEAPVCACPLPPPVLLRYGLSTSFWEPARIAETVSEAWCFPSLGLKLGAGKNNGTTRTQAAGAGTNYTFNQVHWIVFPVSMILGTILNSACLTVEGFDIAYPTEIDPLWNDDSLTAFIQPEVVLFANPLAQLACAVDAVAANAGCANSFQPWCLGSWGSAYPLTGRVSSSERETASAAAVAKMLYKLHRQSMILDYALWNCAGLPSPVWVKHHWRMQPALPVRPLAGETPCQPIGRSSMIWGINKFPPYFDNNVAWMIWRQRGCCAF
ncbi:MAG: hypothetical protein A2600_09875 [Candidatus Lambdaproteobacteria bacterium RIFOXYD1_FULL_56_27]|uniref:Conjugal transfer protein TraU n=1 Tax=Candidatus Lambdaproteobacteria bacterium RIFOXYD2_FULL_56_26 TaxID=1817773 RepID=A0A1F6GUD1_9PROT|nr:MAG: hypothetical protein A2557_11815 [Candidatus Lambdaproteobacteria bacterium RIFOXYD2_FULL_56_26]OGH04325.1 MAG: hypothetical protein A2426_05730 [Candidatus Lambdaproteobacteria bacterium RIFOXYC1_FULL_56_13]OGH07387.1 MAG: hypothetical protein A2600_09875 [Candidatus Lambdaproteobacteria bacterium RIFOXYD1_FULL_56_27]